MSVFHRATRQQVPLKLGITGPSGSGKTTAALRLTRGLVGADAPIAFLDTENGSASLYADITPFDVVNMNPPYAVVKFTRTIEEAVQAGYKALIIDSASAEWQELLTEKEALDARGGNSFANWATITKKHEDFLKAVRNAPIHLILCLRAKQDHVQDKDANGKTTIRKVGMAAVQRDGMEYELTTVFDLAMDHNYKVSKDRTRLFDGRVEQISEQTGRDLAAWLASGAELTPQEPPSAPATATQGTASPAAKEGTQAPQPAAQSAGQPGTTGGNAPHPIQAAASGATSPSATLAEPSAGNAGASSSPMGATADPDPLFVELLAELAAVTLQAEMPTASRTALITLWEKDGPPDLDGLRQEIATIKSTIKVETHRQALQAQQDVALARKAPISDATHTFVDGLECDETNGGITPEQYQALNTLIGAYGLNRDALRSYCATSGKLLAGKNGPTLARLKAEEFAKLRDKLVNKTKAGKDPQGKDETWSARTVRIINATAISQPYKLAS